jgi:hypothetical protein
MKAQELVDLLNELLERMPRIVTTLELQKIPIDLCELMNGSSDVDKFGMENGKRKLHVTFEFGMGNQPLINFAGLLGGLCEDDGITFSMADKPCFKVAHWS